MPSSNESSRANSPQPSDPIPLTDNKNEDPLNNSNIDSLLDNNNSSKDVKLVSDN